MKQIKEKIKNESTTKSIPFYSSRKFINCRSMDFDPETSDSEEEKDHFKWRYNANQMDLTKVIKNLKSYKKKNSDQEVDPMSLFKQYDERMKKAKIRSKNTSINFSVWKIGFKNWVK
jgi:hypothetical protein